MNTIAPDDPGNEGNTLLPSAHTPEPEPDGRDTIPTPRPVPPLPGGTRVNPHGVKRSAGQLSLGTDWPRQADDRPTELADGAWTRASSPRDEMVDGAPIEPIEAGNRDDQAPAVDDTPSESGREAVPPPTRDRAGVARGGLENDRAASQPWPAAFVRPTRQSKSVPSSQPQTTIGAVGGGFALAAVVFAVIAPFVPFVSIGEPISLWGSEAGNNYSYTILAAALVGAVGSVLLLASTGSRTRGRWGGILSMVAGAVLGGVAAYLVLNSDHRAVIAQGGSFGAAVWLLIAAAGALLIGSILGLVRGSLKEG